MNRPMPVPYRCVGGPRDGSTENLWPDSIKTSGTITFLEGSLHSPRVTFSEYEFTNVGTLVFLRLVHWNS